MARTIVGRKVAGQQFKIEVSDEQYVEVRLVDGEVEHNVCREVMLPSPIRTLRYVTRRAREIAAQGCRDEQSRAFADAFVAALERQLTPELEHWGVRKPGARPDLLAEANRDMQPQQ